MPIPDNYDIWRAHQDEEEQRLKRYPQCCHCEKHITEDFLFKIEGDLWCEDCMLDEFRKPTDDFMNE